jgi:hypothetical protein
VKADLIGRQEPHPDGHPFATCQRRQDPTPAQTLGPDEWGDSSQTMPTVLRRQVAEPESVLVQGVIDGQPTIRESEPHSHGTVRQVIAGPFEKLYRLNPLPPPGRQHLGNVITPTQPEAVRGRPHRCPGHVYRFPRDRQVVKTSDG